MLRRFIFGLAMMACTGPAYSDSLSPWFGGESQEPFRLTVTEGATQVSDITNSIDKIDPSELVTNSTTCLPDSCPGGAKTAKVRSVVAKASKF
jgi:hypothetical protein